MLRKAASRMLKAGVPSKLSVPDAEFTKRIGAAANDMRLPAHHGLCLPFFSWDVHTETLLDAASVRASGDLLDACQHLVGPQDPAVRFSQAGVGLVGVDPRHVAWRTFLDCQRGDVASSDFLMDLASFAWFVQQSLCGSVKAITLLTLILRPGAYAGWFDLVNSYDCQWCRCALKI